MLYDITRAEYVEGYKLKIMFEDNKQGIVDFSGYIAKGGVFSKFSDIDFFKNFSVSDELGTIVWNNEIDIAPETLYKKCSQGDDTN